MLCHAICYLGLIYKAKPLLMNKMSVSILFHSSDMANCIDLDVYLHDFCSIVSSEPI